MRRTAPRRKRQAAAAAARNRRSMTNRPGCTLALGRRGRVHGLRERRAELLAGADAELCEHLVQVVFDRAWADEQLGADLRVRAPLLREPGHLPLLRGE